VYATGPAPAVFRDALHEIGAKETRLELVDAASIRMTVTVRVRREDGSAATRTGSTLMRRSRPHTSTTSGRERRQAGASALARRWYYQGISTDELLRLSGSDNPRYARRMVREELASTGTASKGSEAAPVRSLPSQGLLSAIAAHPVCAARAAVWCRLHPNDPLPAGMDAGWAELVADTYQRDGYWTIRRPDLDHRADHRQDDVSSTRTVGGQ
jgi:hypothetical protein